MRSDNTALFIEHRGALVEYAAGIVGSKAHAEDLVQEAWLRFDEVAKKRLLSEPCAISTASSGTWRWMGAAAWRASRLPCTRDGVDAAAAVSLDQPSTPEAVALYRNQLSLLMEALAELPERNRIAFEMHRFAGCTLREIAEVLDISISHAQVLVVDAVQHCKHRLKWP